MSKDGSAQTIYGFTATHDTAVNTMRQSVTLDDPGGVGQKYWSFNLPGSSFPLLIASYEGRDKTVSPQALQQVSTTWTNAAFGPYISSTTTTMNPGTGSAVAKRVDQAVDQLGNLTSMTLYDYNGAVRRSFANTYLSTSAYTTRYMRNRLLYSQVTEAGTTTLLVNNWYDAYTGLTGTTGAPGGGTINCAGSAMATAYTPRQFDSTYTTSFTTRGNLTQSQGLSGVTNCMRQFDNAGNVLQTADQTGVITSANTNSSTNYAAPSAITVGSLTSQFNYAADLLPTQATGPNGDTSSTVYDQYARPTSSTSKTGAVTYFNYINSPPQVLAYTNPAGGSAGRVARTTLDGFGRTIKQESGTGTYSGGTIALTTVVSTVDTAYDSCGCSPMGKLKQTSRPYAPGGTVYWTVYAYDGIGRTKTVTGADGSSKTSYTYLGSNVTVTDAASKSKTFTTDAVGNLTQVQETDPNLGAVYTSYVYDVLNRLRTVSMPRGSTTQTRTFTYTGALLTSVTNPENGTVSSYYNTDDTLAYKIDAKGQKVAFTYDSYKRVSQISRYPDGVNEDVCQRVSYNYDSNPDISSYPFNQYNAGRMTSVHYGGASCSTFQGSGPTATTGNNYVEMYAYTQAGQVTNKRLRLSKQVGSANPVTVFSDLEALYTYDTEGKMTSVQYPLWVKYQYTFDSLGRPTKMTDTNSGQDLVSAVTYGPAGELLSMTGASVGETRTYNSMGQLLTLTGLNGVNLKYNYAATGANNGQIASQQDLVSGETITYAYDSLKRLASATSTQGWNQNFGYDGFGNLTGKTGSGVAPVGSYPADPATNRLSGILYDANGNQLYANGNTLVYDVSNRMTSSSGQSLGGLYEYDASNKRVYQAKQSFNGTTWVTNAQEYYFYGINGKKIGTYFATVSGSGAGASISWSLQSTQLFFRGRLIQRSFGAVQEDVRGSVGSYYPYGEDRTATANDAIKFATYVRDSVSGLDYAKNRYHLPGMGRFASPDRSRRSGRKTSPPTWNRYPYVHGDPVNSKDSKGLDSEKLCLDDNSEPDPTCTGDGGGEGGGGDGGGGDPDDMWEVAGDNAEAADQLLVGARFSPDCGNYILNTLGIEIQQIQGTAANANLVNEATSDLEIGAAMFPNDPTLAANEQRTVDAQSGHPGTTVAQFWSLNPQTHAFGQYGGNTIFYNPSYFENAGSGTLLYLELHETLHLLGLSDALIQTAFGITVGAASDNITIKLMTECGH